MMTISLCMIVKNEEDVLARCLDCVQGIADEIVIVDTGSTDRTKEIAGEYTDKVYDFEWIDDFAAARNFSFSKASCDYILWLDADDVLFEEDRQRFVELKQTLSDSIDMVLMKYNIAFDSGGRPTFSYYRERLFKRSRNYRWVGHIHEVIEPSGSRIYSSIAVSHKKMHPNEPMRNLRIFEKMVAEGVELDPRQQYYYGRELMYNGRYRDSIKILEAFLEGGQGWIENCVGACGDIARCWYALGEERKALYSLLRSMEYDEPRAEFCCDLGSHFYDRGDYHTAIFWYELATTRTPKGENGGFEQPDCYGYRPFLQLCVCYDRLGEHEKAALYNEKAGILKPDDPAVAFNRSYFARLRTGAEKEEPNEV